jgi:hypothetical protein
MSGSIPHGATGSDFGNITCAEFLSLSDREKRLFVVGVGNGRGMTAGLFQAYANAAQDMSGDPVEKEAIAHSYQTIHGMLEPLLSIDAMSLLNGITAACSRPEFRERLVIEAIAAVHVDAAKALREWRDK